MSVTARDGDWIAIDWGTTNMRAMLVADGGAVRDRAAAGPGMAALARSGRGAAGFEDALREAIDGWVAGPIDVLVCGMAGARQGWVEAPYREVPAALDGLLAAAVRVPTRDARVNIRIVPGLCAREPRPDVMRGEETQLLGLLRQDRATRVCMPGTHSKWVELDGERVTGFRTHMTGELNAVLTDHSILATSLADASGEAFDEDAFDDAVRAAIDAGGAVLDRLFAIRAAGLLAGTSASHARATLSGLLIGAELAREVADDPSPVALVGSGGLVQLYARALAVAGVGSTVHDGTDLAVAGLAAMRQGGA